MGGFSNKWQCVYVVKFKCVQKANVNGILSDKIDLQVFGYAIKLNRFIVNKVY